MKILTQLLVCLFVGVLSISAANAAGSVRCGKLLDVRAGRLLNDQLVVFDDAGVITSVGAFSSGNVPTGATPVDLTSSTCLPGLIDVHTHLTSDPANSGY